MATHAAADLESRLRSALTGAPVTGSLPQQISICGGDDGGNGGDTCTGCSMRAEPIEPASCVTCGRHARAFRSHEHSGCGEGVAHLAQHWAGSIYALASLLPLPTSRHYRIGSWACRPYLLWRCVQPVLQLAASWQAALQHPSFRAIACAPHPLLFCASLVGMHGGMPIFSDLGGRILLQLGVCNHAILEGILSVCMIRNWRLRCAVQCVRDTVLCECMATVFG
jgi:hypothetical protein